VTVFSIVLTYAAWQWFTSMRFNWRQCIQWIKLKYAAVVLIVCCCETLSYNILATTMTRSQSFIIWDLYKIRHKSLSNQSQNSVAVKILSCEGQLLKCGHSCCMRHDVISCCLVWILLQQSISTQSIVQLKTCTASTLSDGMYHRTVSPRTSSMPVSSENLTWSCLQTSFVTTADWQKLSPTCQLTDITTVQIVHFEES